MTSSTPPTSAERPTITRKLPPRAVEAEDPMPDEYRELVVRLIKETGEFMSMKPFRAYLRELTTRIIDLAPDNASRLRVADFYADESRHGVIFEGMLRTLGLDPVKEFGDNMFTSIEALHLTLTEMNTWADFAISTCLLDRCSAYSFQACKESSYAPLARVAPMIEHDERGHSTMGMLHLKNLCKTAEGRSQAQELLGKWYPLSLDAFGTSTGKRQWKYIEWGIKTRSNEDGRRLFIEEVDPMLREIGLDPPDPMFNRKFV